MKRIIFTVIVMITSLFSALGQVSSSLELPTFDSDIHTTGYIIKINETSYISDGGRWLEFSKSSLEVNTDETIDGEGTASSALSNGWKVNYSTSDVSSVGFESNSAINSNWDITDGTPLDGDLKFGRANAGGFLQFVVESGETYTINGGTGYIIPSGKESILQYNEENDNWVVIGGNVGGGLSGTGGVNTIPVFTTADETLTGSLNFVESGGNVAIGTFIPAAKLHVKTSTPFTFANKSTAGIKFGSPTGGSMLLQFPSLNSTFDSGFALTGNFSGLKSTTELIGYGVRSGGGYEGSLLFKTSYDTTMIDRMRIDNAGVRIWNNLELDAGILDSNGELGTAGQVLSSTSTLTDWVDDANGIYSGSGDITANTTVGGAFDLDFDNADITLTASNFATLQSTNAATVYGITSAILTAGDGTVGGGGSIKIAAGDAGTIKIASIKNSDVESIYVGEDQNDNLFLAGLDITTILPKPLVSIQNQTTGLIETVENTLPSHSTTFPTNPYDGQEIYRTDQNQWYYHDIVRARWIGREIMTQSFGNWDTATADDEMRVEGDYKPNDSGVSLSGITLLNNSLVVGWSANKGDTTSETIQLRDDANSVEMSFTYTTRPASDDTVSVALVNTKTYHLHCSTGSLSYPFITIYYRRDGGPATYAT